MVYAQKNYLAPLGQNSTFRIDKYGCFLTAYSNILEAFGTNIDPLALNQEFINAGSFMYVGDVNPDGSHAIDGLGWGSLTKRYGNIVPVEINNNANGSWPQSNNAIVKFAFRGTTHFSKVADYTQQLILDSWDGVVRHIGYYGQPVAYAIYENTDKPAQIPAMTQVQAASSKSHVGEMLVLPASISSWRIYNIGGPYSSNPDTSIAKLNPAQFGGLSYEVLDNLASNVYEIQTKMFGKVAIYAGPDTPASFQAKEAPAPVAPTPTPETVAPVVEAPVTPPVATVDVVQTPTEEVKVPVVNPEDFKTSYSEAEGDYIANKTTTVNDIEGLQVDIILKKGQKVKVAGTFKKDGQAYYRTKKSVDSGFWYGLPEDILTFISGKAALDEANKQKAIDDLFKEVDLGIEKITNVPSVREKFISGLARIQALFIRKFKITKRRSN